MTGPTLHKCTVCEDGGRDNCPACGGIGMVVSLEEHPAAGTSFFSPEKTQEIPMNDIKNIGKKRGLPSIVKKLTNGFDAWVVGSAADPYNEDPKDYDVQVPFSTWGKACMLIPKDAVPNSFGGFRFEDDGMSIDVWPGELGWIFQRPSCKWAWHPASGIFITKVKMTK